MLQLTRRLRCSSTAAGLLAALRSSQSTTLAQTVQVLEAYTSDASVAEASLAQLVHLDQDDSDSAALAHGPGRRAVLTAMQAHVNEVRLKEMCCRCIANMALVGEDGATAASTATPSTVAASSSSSSSSASPTDAAATATVADSLVAANAVEMVLGTLAAASRLTPKGLCWASTALLNLTMRSADGAARAAAHGGEDTLANGIERLVLEATECDAAVLPLYLTAMDACLGALCRILSTSLPDNGKRLQFRYQAVSFAVVESVVGSLKLIGDVLRKLTVFDKAEAHERTATSRQDADRAQREALRGIATCCLHKQWEVLRLVGSHHPNVPLVFDALHGGRVGPTVLTLCLTHSGWLDHRAGAMAAAADADGGLLAKLFVASLDTVTVLSSRRQDLAGRQGTEDAQAILPTDAAQYVVSTLCNGDLSSRALELLRPMLRSAMRDPSAIAAGDAAAVEQTRDAAARLLSLLLNLSEHDPVVAKKETVILVCDAMDALIDAAAGDGGVLPADARMALVGRCLSCAWNICNTPEGVESMRAMEMPAAVDRLVAAVDAATAKTLQAQQSSPGTAASSSPLPAYEKLGDLARRLQSKLSALITNPVYAHTKFEGKP